MAVARPLPSGKPAVLSKGMAINANYLVPDFLGNSLGT